MEELFGIHGEDMIGADKLAESFAISQKLQRAEAIAMIGFLLGQVLAMGGNTDEALAVLDQSAAAFDKLEQAKKAAQVRDLQQRIREKEEEG